MVVRITDVEPDHHITGTGTAEAERLFGPLTLSYLVRPRRDDPARSRLLVCLWVGVSGLPRRIAGEALVWGDLIMMGKQLLNLKACAEAPAPNGSLGGGC